MKKISLLLLLILVGFYVDAQTIKHKKISVKNSDSVELANLKNFDKNFIQIKRLDFNTSKAEYAPVFYSNGIVFSKSKSILTDFSPTKRLKREYKSTLYYSSLDIDYRNAKPLKINVKNRIAENQSIFHKPSESVYYTALSSTNESIINKVDAESNSSKFTASTFNLNGIFYSTINQCISKSGKKLFFSSNLQDGFGGMDIYVSELIDDEWTEPINLGPKVNTAADDLYPFIFEDSLLYFATSGRLGLGGLDVFVYNFKEKSTKNVGAPINSAYDDFGLIRFAKVNNGYFSSNREENGSNTDIYSFKAIRPKTQEIQLNIVDANSGKIVDNVKLNSSSNLSKEIEYFKLLDGKLTGMKFEPGVPYKFFIKSYGYYDKETTVVFNKADNLISLYIERDLSIDTTLKEEEEKWVMAENYTFRSRIKSYIKQVFNTNFRSENSGNGNSSLGYSPINTIYFDFNKYKLTSESIVLLDQLSVVLKEQKALKVSIISYTDSRGSKDYNLKLSYKRANVTAKYLIKKGVTKSRIKSTGKGELNPIQKCTKDCTEADHAMNRRTEIIIK